MAYDASVGRGEVGHGVKAGPLQPPRFARTCAVSDLPQRRWQRLVPTQGMGTFLYHQTGRIMFATRESRQLYCELLKRVNKDGNYYEDSIDRLFELVTGIPPGMVAWSKLDNIGRVQMYVYDPDGEHLGRIRACWNVTRFERPEDHQQPMPVDWLVWVEVSQ